MSDLTNKAIELFNELDIALKEFTSKSSFVGIISGMIGSENSLNPVFGMGDNTSNGILEGIDKKATLTEFIKENSREEILNELCDFVEQNFNELDKILVKSDCRNLQDKEKILINAMTNANNFFAQLLIWVSKNDIANMTQRQYNRKIERLKLELEEIKKL